MSKCKRCDKLHILRNNYCEGCQPYQRIAELEAKLQALEAENKRYRRRLKLIARTTGGFANDVARTALEGGE